MNIIEKVAQAIYAVWRTDKYDELSEYKKDMYRMEVKATIAALAENLDEGAVYKGAQVNFTLDGAFDKEKVLQETRLIIKRYLTALKDSK